MSQLNSQPVARPSLNTILPLILDVRCKGEAFPSKRCKLKKFNVAQPKTSIDSLLVREMLRPYKSDRITWEPDAEPGCHSEWSPENRDGMKNP